MTSTNTDGTARRHVSQFLTPATVDSATRWASTDDYRDAVAMLPGLARRYADGDDVASVARVLLGDCLDSGLRGSLAAGAAVKRAAGNLYAVARDVLANEVAAGDTRDGDTPGTYLPRATFPAPDGLAHWGTADTLATVTSTLDPASLLLLGTAFAPEHADSRGRHGVSGTALASTLAGQPVKAGRASTAALDSLTAALGLARANVASTLARTDAGDSDSRGKGTDCPRWDDVLTGPASPVVCWGPVSGPLLPGQVRPFLAHAVLSGGDVVTADTREALAPLLSLLTCPGGDAGTVREGRDADLLASTDAGKSARPIPGVRAGMRAGHAVAGTGSAYVKRASGKRKRDGGIGGPMTRA